MLEDGFGPWRSMSVFFFNFVVIFYTIYFHFRLVRNYKTIGTATGKASSNGGKKHEKSAKNNLNIIGAPCLVSIACWRRGTSVRQYISAPCASSMCEPMPLIVLLLGFTERKQKYVEDQMRTTLKVNRHRSPRSETIFEQ
jgi:hypothetical protein